MGQPEDLMGAVTFLCSDASGYVTGVYRQYISLFIIPFIKFFISITTILSFVRGDGREIRGRNPTCSGATANLSLGGGPLPWGGGL